MLSYLCLLTMMCTGIRQCGKWKGKFLSDFDISFQRVRCVQFIRSPPGGCWVLFCHFLCTFRFCSCLLCFNIQEPSLGYTIPLSQKSRSGSDLFHISNLIENRGWTKVIAKFLCTHSTQINTQFSIKIQDTNGNQFPCPLSYSLPDVQT